MPSYGKGSLAALATARPSLQKLFSVVIQAFDHSVTCGHRTENEQNLAFLNKKSKAKWPYSPHNEIPSKAVDAGPYNHETKNIDWPDEKVGKIVWNSHSDAPKFIKTLARWYYFGGFVMGVAFAMGINLKWGGDWDKDTILYDQTFDDLPHFEEIDE